MESHPQNPEFRNNLENFHPCTSSKSVLTHSRWQGRKFKRDFISLLFDLFYFLSPITNVISFCDRLSSEEKCEAPFFF